MNILEKNQSIINQLCTQHNVKTMYPSGSVLTNHFNSNSDVDLLVKFNDFDVAKYFINYTNLKESLENILHKKVDLIEEQTFKTPILIRSINNNKQLIYG
ncbi:MAG TPA: nucleotidyltransferase domain-containing protein [Chitinophagales bacterium]|nr:nucleotidyltransferase domain-containing protein [Chitinophagales bacterium]